MIPENGTAQLQELRGWVERLERRELDHGAPAGPPFWGPLIEQVAFWQVRGLAKFWAKPPQTEQGGEDEIDYPQHMCDLVTGLYDAPRVFTYLLLGSEEGIALYLGVQGNAVADSQHDPASQAGDAALLPDLAKGIFPGIELSPQLIRGLGVGHAQKGLFRHTGMMTGIPTCKLATMPSEDRRVSQQLERLMRGASGNAWGYLVRAEALPLAEMVAKVDQTWQEISYLSRFVNQQTSIQGVQTRVVDGKLHTPSLSYEQTNYVAKHCLELLDRNRDRFLQGRAEGMWKTTVYYFAESAAVCKRLGALLRAIFSGNDSTPEVIRTFGRASQPVMGDGKFYTLLTSREVATLCHLPREEFAGYALRDYARFDCDLPKPLPSEPFVIGKVLDGLRPTTQNLAIGRGDLSKHALIAGVPGSGKTTTVFSMLDQLYQRGAGTPFLVFEPAKTEYRSLLREGTRFPGLRVYTLGDERVAPFRLNPFEFPIADAENRIHVQTHIDYLKAVFNAAFVLYAPMPYVLEACLHEIYVDKGWDLATSTNRRLPAAQVGKEANWPLFPTLTDLYEKVDEVVDRLGYDERIERDVKAGLKARLGSLRLGGKGLMLDCPHSLPMAELMAQPTVLEMAAMGNDDEKAFLLGLLLTALYEHHMVYVRLRGEQSGKLVHLTVLEEAHRLLKNVSTEVDTESSNTRGQAVETFTNMLSEIRAYGEGILIAEQIPTKLAPDATKNTNLKIVHRLLAEDERAVLAASMNMSEAQSRFLVTLRTGEAVVFAEGADHPYHLAMADFKSAAIRVPITDGEIRLAMAGLLASSHYDFAPSMGTQLVAGTLDQLVGVGKTRALVRDYALRLVDDVNFRQCVDRYLLGCVVQPDAAVDLFAVFPQRARQLWIDAQLLMPVLFYGLLLAIERHGARQGQRYEWPYQRVSNTYGYLVRALATLVRGYPFTSADESAQLTSLAQAVRDDLLRFQTNYRQLTTKAAPYAGCHFCRSHCLYRFEAQRVAEVAKQQQDFDAIIVNTDDDLMMWRQLRQHAVASARQVVQVADGTPPEDAVICYTLHVTLALQYKEVSQHKVLKTIADLAS